MRGKKEWYHKNKGKAVERVEQTVGRTVQRLRKAKGLTQEQLAGQLGVSSAAVSKWETGGALPDVALLCPLARALGCTANELLNFRPELTAEEIDTLCTAARRQFEAGEKEQAAALCEERLRQYPTDLNLAFRVGFLYARYGGGEEALLKRAIVLFREAAALPDEEQRRSAWQMLARLYARQGQYQPAMEALGHLPSCNQEGMSLRAAVLRQMGRLEEAEQLERGALAALFSALQATLLSLAETARRQGRPEEAQQLQDRAEAVEALFGQMREAPVHACCPKPAAPGQSCKV